MMNEDERAMAIRGHFGELGVYTCEQLKAVGDMVAERGDEKVYASLAEGKLRFYLPATGELVALEPYSDAEGVRAMNEGYWESPDTWNCGHADQKRYGVVFRTEERGLSGYTDSIPTPYPEPEGYFANLCQECVRQNNVPQGRIFQLQGEVYR